MRRRQKQAKHFTATCCEPIKYRCVACCDGAAAAQCVTVGFVRLEITSGPSEGKAGAHKGGKAAIVRRGDLLDVRFDSAVEDSTMQLMDDLQVAR